MWRKIKQSSWNLKEMSPKKEKSLEETAQNALEQILKERSKNNGTTAARKETQTKSQI